MIQNAKHTPTPGWLPLASGTIKAIQHRKNPHPSFDEANYDPIGELLGAPHPAPPMIDLGKDWTVRTDNDGPAFSVKRPDRIGGTFELLTALRLCATFGDREAVEALCDPAAITIIRPCCTNRLMAGAPLSPDGLIPRLH